MMKESACRLCKIKVCCTVRTLSFKLHFMVNQKRENNFFHSTYRCKYSTCTGTVRSEFYVYHSLIAKKFRQKGKIIITGNSLYYRSILIL